ncbi:transporter substrate-binding domain-containing protein [bacterium]|nr:transporter substrate-binding domain-containing protein [bacterium]
MKRRSALLTWVILPVLLFVLVACGQSEPTPEPTATALPPTATPVPPTPEPPTATPEPTTAPTDTPAPAPTAASTEAPAEEANGLGQITIGLNLNFPPFAYRGEENQWEGFDVDLMNALAATSGFQVRYLGMPFEGMLERGLSSSEIDAVISAITVTEERAAVVDFSEPYFDGSQGLAVRNDNGTIQSVTDITADTRVGVKIATTGAEYAAANLPVTAVPYEESQLLVDALVNGEVDAIVLDAGVLAWYVNSGIAITLIDSHLTNEAYAVAVNQARPDVLAAVNAALAQVRVDGTYDALLVKWFGQDFADQQ